MQQAQFQISQPTSQHSNEFDQLLQREFTPKAPDIIFDDGAFARIERIAKLMAAGHSTVPKHLQGNVTDCFAIAMQAHMWGMNAFNVAQKTHVVNGILGYEAQLVNAVVCSCGAIEGRFHYEYKGDGNNLECRVGAKIAGESEITWGEWLSIATVKVKNSPLWATNPKQQLGYLQVKNWSRAYVPGALMGVYSDDELISGPASMDAISRVDLSSPPEAADEIIEKMNQCSSLEQLELLKPQISVLKGEAHKRARSAYTAAKKRISPPPEPSVSAPETTIDIAEVMAAIAQMTDKPSREYAMNLVNQLAGDDKVKAEEAFKSRFDALKQQAEIAKAAGPAPDYSDWIAAIDGASDSDELETIATEMPDDAYKALKSQIDKKHAQWAQSNDNDPFAAE